jgi:hypothetical protein
MDRKYKKRWSGRRESNPQPTAWKAVGRSLVWPATLQLFFYLRTTAVSANTK